MDLLLDTDALIWVAQGSPRLGARARVVIDQASDGGSVRFSAVSMLEATRLHWADRIDLPGAPARWFRDLLGEGVHEIPVTSEIAILAGSLKALHGFHADPADQLITATAIVTRRRMVTSDRKTLSWASGRREIECVNACL